MVSDRLTRCGNCIVGAGALSGGDCNVFFERSLSGEFSYCSSPTRRVVTMNASLASRLNDVTASLICEPRAADTRHDSRFRRPADERDAGAGRIAVATWSVAWQSLPDWPRDPDWRHGDRVRGDATRSRAAGGHQSAHGRMRCGLAWCTTNRARGTHARGAAASAHRVGIRVRQVGGGRRVYGDGTRRGTYVARTLDGATHAALARRSGVWRADRRRAGGRACVRRGAWRRERLECAAHASRRHIRNQAHRFRRRAQD